MNTKHPKNAKQLAVMQARNGLGVFACSTIQPGEMILPIEGVLIHWRKLLKKESRTLSNAYRIGPETYLLPQGIPEYFNHSCNPNAGLKKISGRLFLVCLRRIKKGEEVVFDYSTQIGADDIWRMRCSCGEQICRKRIGPFNKLPKGQLQRYLEQGIIPKYILDTA